MTSPACAQAWATRQAMTSRREARRLRERRSDDPVSQAVCERGRRLGGCRDGGLAIRKEALTHAGVVRRRAHEAV